MVGTWLPETCSEIEINIHEKELCVKMVIYKDVTIIYNDICAVFPNVKS